MSDCQMELDGRLWCCPLCGWVYPLPSDRPPRRNCPAGELAAAADAELRPKSPCGCAAAERLKTELAARFLSGRATRSAVDVENLLSICRRCGKFQGDRCQCFGPAEFLAVLTDSTRECGNWKTKEATDTRG